MGAENNEEVKKSISSTISLANKARDARAGKLAIADKNIAKNRIARVVIYSFCITLVIFVIAILYSVMFSTSSSWKDGVEPIMEVLQKIYMPIVTLAFGFYNSTDKD